MYRNDHDAALARIDALEGEVRRLQGELERREAPPEQPPRQESREPVVVDDGPRAASVAKLIAVCIFVTIYALCGPTHHHHHYSSRPVPHVHYQRPADPPYDRDYQALQRAIANLRTTESHVSQ